MLTRETPPAPVIVDGDDVQARPCFRVAAYVDIRTAGDALVVFGDLVSRLARPIMTVGSGTHLKPKERRHRLKDEDFEGLGRILDPSVLDGGFKLYGNAETKASPFALPYFCVTRWVDDVVIELAFRWDTDPFAVDRDVWPAIRALKPAYALMGWAILPFPNGTHESARAAARHKGRYRIASALDVEDAEKGVTNEAFIAAHNARHGDDAKIGIYDVGWKTWLGPGFAGRIAPLQDGAMPGVAVIRQEEGALEIVVGDGPVWGDVNVLPPEAFEPYRALLRHLRPIKLSENWLRTYKALGFPAEAGPVIDTYFSLWDS